jgi:hypothetical protein
VVEWTKNVYAAILDHYSQEKPVHVDKSDKEVDLGHILHVRDGFAAHSD